MKNVKTPCQNDRQIFFFLKVEFGDGGGELRGILSNKHVYHPKNPLKSKHRKKHPPAQKKMAEHPAFINSQLVACQLPELFPNALASSNLTAVHFGFKFKNMSFRSCTLQSFCEC